MPSPHAMYLQGIRVALVDRFGDCFHLPPDADFLIRSVAASIIANGCK